MGITKGKGLALVALGLGLFMTMLDGTIVNISIPTMMEDLNADVSHISWVLDAYLITLAVLVLTMGRLADQFGRRLIYNVGIGVFMLGSLLCAVSWDVNWLIGFRAFQAVGGAIMIPVTMAITTAMFPPERRGAAMGIWAAIGMTAAAAGPSLGGFFVEYLSWHWIFYINIPIGVIALVLSRRSVPESKDPQAPKKVDFPGILTFSISAFSLVLAIIKGEAWGWGSGYIISLFTIAAVFLIAFIAVERWQSKPVVELRLFRNVTFSSAGVGQVLVAFSMLGAIFLLTLFLQNVMGYSALRAAVAITPIPITGLVVTPIAGRVCDKIGSRIPAMLGAVALGLGLYLFSQLQVDSEWMDIAWRSVIVGAGIGLSNAGLAVAAMGAVPTGKEGVGAGVLNMSRMMGMALGIAICVALLSTSASNHLNDAKVEVQAVVMEDQQLPDLAKERILAEIEDISGQEGLQSVPDLAAMAAEMGVPEAMLPHLEQLSQQISSIFRLHMGRAFKDVFPIAGIVGGISIIPALFLRRRDVQGRAPP
ncbi:Multidrug resistance protein Stp [subsurface metagenome]